MFFAGACDPAMPYKLNNGTMIKNPLLIITHLSGIDKFKHLVLKEGWQWSYMGSNANEREAAIESLSSAQRYCYAQELKDLSTNNKAEFLNWMAELGRSNNDILWWSTNIAYKNPMASDIFLNYCCLALIQKWIGANVEKRLLIVEDPALVKASLINFNSPNVQVDWDGGAYRKESLKRELISFVRIVMFLFRSIGWWVLGKLYCVLYRAQVEKVLSVNYDVLIYSWVENTSFPGNGYHDRYLGRLKKIYGDLGCTTGFLAAPDLPRSLLKRVYQCGEVVPLLNFVKLSNVLGVFFKASFLPWNDDTNGCSGLDLKPLVDSGVKRGKGEHCYYVLHYWATLNFFDHQGSSCKVLVYPFENMPREKVMIMAVRRSGSACRLVAYQHTTIPNLLLNFYLGEGEPCPQPDVIVSNGEHWRGVLERAGFTCSVVNGGSLRYSNPGSGGKAEAVPRPNAGEDPDKNILVLLSASLGYSLDLIYFMIRASINGKNVLLKSHPDMPEKVIRKFVPMFPGNFRFAGGSISDWVGSAKWVIHVGTTGAIECMVQGANVIKYLPERIDLDPVGSEMVNCLQETIIDGETLSFKPCERSSRANVDLIAEPIKQKCWESLLAIPPKK